MSGNSSNKINWTPEVANTPPSSNRQVTFNVTPTPLSPSWANVSIEHGRGHRIAFSPHLGGGQFANIGYQAQVQEQNNNILPNSYSCLSKYQVPMSIRCKVDGIGINQYDPYSESVGAERSPIHIKPPVFNMASPEKIFDQFDNDSSYTAMFGKQAFVQNHFQRRTYGRPAHAKPKPPPFRPAISETRLIRDPRYPTALGNISPLSTSSSSSLDSPPGAFTQFNPMFQSSLLTTPPTVRRSHRHRLLRHPNLAYSTHTYEASEPEASASSPSAVSSIPEESDDDFYLPESPIASQ